MVDIVAILVFQVEMFLYDFDVVFSILDVCMYVCLSHFFASVGAHSRLASLSKIWVCGFLWYFRKISGVVFFIFSKFSFFGLFGGLKNLKNGQKIFFGKFFFDSESFNSQKNHVLNN